MLCLLSQSKLCIIIQIWHQVLMFHLPYVAGLLSKAVKTSVFATSSPFKDLSPAEKYSLTTGWNKTESWSKYSKAFSSFLKSVGIKWDKADNYSIVAKPNTTLKFSFISFFYGKNILSICLLVRESHTSMVSHVFSLNLKFVCSLSPDNPIISLFFPSNRQYFDVAKIIPIYLFVSFSSYFNFLLLFT